MDWDPATPGWGWLLPEGLAQVGSNDQGEALTCSEVHEASFSEEVLFNPQLSLIS